MKKILITFLILISVSLISNYGYFLSIYNNYLGNSYYDLGEYENALNYHEKVLYDYKYYNLGNDYYKLGDYLESVESYKQLELEADKLGLHNLGNTYFLAGVSQKDVDTTIMYYAKSLESFSGSLKIEERLKTRENYNYVKSLLDELKQKEEEKKKEEERKQKEKTESIEKKEEQDNSANGEENDTNDESKIEEKSDEESNEQKESGDKSGDEGDIIKDQRGDNYKLKEDQSMKPLNANEKTFLEEYTAKLKKEQNHNQQYFNKKKADNNGDLFDSIINEQFQFDKEFDNGGEKDW